MEIQKALILFDALSQETRLQAFRLLVEAGTKGLAAGVISERLGIPHNTLSFHLNHLSHAGIVSSHKQGRSVIYVANFELMKDLISFMVKDCCGSDVATVQEDQNGSCSLIEFSQCCPTEEKS